MARVELDGIAVPCFTLEAARKNYLETRREEKAKAIREFLETREKSK